ncbi:MAG: response regulator [Acidobacteriia bacterium]|nr:response regulator [Terriglobia bacterium]
MKKPPAVAANFSGNITVLAVDSCAEDCAALANTFKTGPWSLCPEVHWTLTTAGTLGAAWSVLREGQIPIVLCECDRQPALWHELLEQIALSPNPPFLIVTSRLADDRLWAEALNLGAYDVLAKPFDGSEVTRVVSMAWMHWRDQRGHRALAPRTLVAGGGR